MNEYHLTVSTPSGTVFDGDAVFLSLRGAGGDLAVMAGHIPFVTTVKKCVCKVRFPDETEKPPTARQDFSRSRKTVFTC